MSKIVQSSNKICAQRCDKYNLRKKHANKKRGIGGDASLKTQCAVLNQLKM